MEVLVKSENKTKGKQKTPGTVANSCAVPVAKCHVAAGDGWKNSCTCVLTRNRGKRRRRSAAARRPTTSGATTTC